jgi:hypothetical protein
VAAAPVAVAPVAATPPLAGTVVGTLIAAGVTETPPADSVSPTAETPGIAAVEATGKVGSAWGALAATAALDVAAGGVPVGEAGLGATLAAGAPVGVGLLVVGASALVVGVSAAAAPALVTDSALTVAR